MNDQQEDRTKVTRRDLLTVTGAIVLVFNLIGWPTYPSANDRLVPTRDKDG